MVLAGNKIQCLLSVNHTTKTIHLHLIVRRLNLEVVTKMLLHQHRSENKQIIK